MRLDKRKFTGLYYTKENNTFEFIYLKDNDEYVVRNGDNIIDIIKPKDVGNILVKLGIFDFKFESRL